MKKRLCSLLLVLTMLSTLLVAPASALEADGSTSVGNETYVYLGVKDYGTVEADSKPDFVHRQGKLLAPNVTPWYSFT